MTLRTRPVTTLVVAELLFLGGSQSAWPSLKAAAICWWSSSSGRSYWRSRLRFTMMRSSPNGCRRGERHARGQAAGHGGKRNVPTLYAMGRDAVDVAAEKTGRRGRLLRFSGASREPSRAGARKPADSLDLGIC